MHTKEILMNAAANTSSTVQVTVKRLVRLFKKQDGSVAHIQAFLSPGEIVTVGATQSIGHNGWPRNFVSVTSDTHPEGDLLALSTELTDAC